MPSRLLWLSVLVMPAMLPAQILIDTAKYAHFAQLFDRPPDKHGLTCEAMPMRPRLNYGFRLVSGYRAQFPMKYLEGESHQLAILMRITPEDSSHKPVMLGQVFKTPRLPRKLSSQIDLDGVFFVGEGNYRVDWLLLDREERTCRKSWRLQAKIPAQDRDLAIDVGPGAVSPILYEPWKGVSTEKLNAEHPLRLTVFLHVAPLSMRRLKLQAYDEAMLLSSVRTLLQSTPFTEIKLVAFNLDQQKELFRQQHFDAAGWMRLVNSFGELELATVPISVLKRTKGHLDIVRNLIEEERTSQQHADAVVFMGPTARQSEKMRFETQPNAGRTQPMFFYFEYKPPWARGQEFPDIISNALRPLSGRVMRIYSPHDFSSAIQELNRSTE